MTLYTLDIDSENAKKRCVAGYGSASVFCFLFQMIYEYFSHGVLSYPMVLAFLIPLIGGIVSLISMSEKIRQRHGRIFRQLLCGGVIWLTLGSLFQGVLEIYGTTNRLSMIYVIVGSVQLGIAAIIALCGMNHTK